MSNEPYVLITADSHAGGSHAQYRRKLLGLTAAKLYKFDLDKLLPLAAKYGPTPTQVSDPLPRAEIPQDSACYLFTNALKAA